MRCFCCDQPANFNDKPTGRFYCGSCWDIIEVLIVSGLEDTDTVLIEGGIFDEREEKSSSDPSDVS